MQYVVQKCYYTFIHVIKGVVILNMNLIYSQRNLKSTKKTKLFYVFDDKLGLLVFTFIILESLLFTNILLSYGASKISFNFSSFSKIHLYILRRELIQFVLQVLLTL